LVNSRNNGPADPDLILHSGGQVVSKALTGFLRRAENVSCWRIGTDSSLIDTFKLVTRSIPLPAAAFYRALSEWPGAAISASYRDIWIETAAKVNDLAREIIRDTPFSDLRVMNRIFHLIPAGTNLVLGNSSVIRYSQIFPAYAKVKYFANRGVSGIDGSLSAAAGIATATEDLTLAIAGDLGFLYDSNALWNRKLPSNLRILVINNGGGGIFHILKGPSDQPGFKNYIEANHPVNLENLAGAYGLAYYFADSEPDLDRQWDAFMRDQGRTAVFEVKTDAATSAAAFRQLMRIPR
jgi:2-succinyl-5-enolpyruvyl-6-hydroxy-3-cyclohexene-1-carboxylate synthase